MIFGNKLGHYSIEERIHVRTLFFKQIQYQKARKCAGMGLNYFFTLNELPILTQKDKKKTKIVGSVVTVCDLPA